MWAGNFAQTVPLLRFMALPNSQEARATIKTATLAILWCSALPSGKNL